MCGDVCLCTYSHVGMFVLKFRGDNYFNSPTLCQGVRPTRQEGACRPAGRSSPGSLISGGRCGRNPLVLFPQRESPRGPLGQSPRPKRGFRPPLLRTLFEGWQMGRNGRGKYERQVRPGAPRPQEVVLPVPPNHS